MFDAVKKDLERLDKVKREAALRNIFIKAAIENHAQLVRYVQRDQDNSENTAVLALAHAKALIEAIAISTPKFLGDDNASTTEKSAT